MSEMSWSMVCLKSASFRQTLSHSLMMIVTKSEVFDTSHDYDKWKEKATTEVLDH